MTFVLAKKSLAVMVSAVLFSGTPLLANKLTADVPARMKKQLIASGQKLAKDKCASCHSITKQGNSTHKDAPPFRTFAKKWPLSSLEESLAEGIVTGHEDMPEVVFTPLQIGEFLEFLGSLEEK
ncbi:MAG: cytochrome c [bacterium]|nr:cytochrome c [bacterium]